MSSPTGPTFPSEAAAPPGYQTVTPWVISSDTARLIEFTEAAFGGRELGRVPGPHGGIGHAEVRIGDSVVMMFDAWPGWPDTPAFLRLYVADADETYARALAAGAAPVTEVTGLLLRRPGRPGPGPAGQPVVDPGPRRRRRSQRAGPAAARPRGGRRAPLR